MAYNNRFLFRFDSVNGVEYNIYILKDGYSGSCEQRALGRGPVLKKKRNGPICGTSLELYAECATDGEFAELYTSDPKKFRADVYRGSNMIWTGFVSTELYSEPSIAPPYDVQIVATDGLGELKQVYFEAPGEISLKALFAQLLSFTGSDRGFYFATNLRHTGGTKSQMLNWTINVDFLDGETCYNVLTKLLESLHATITTYNGRWLIARETDIETLLNSSGGLAVISYSNGTVSTTTIGNVVKTLGQMGQADIHPWGNLSTTIEPARKSVVVAAPWYMKGYLEDPGMSENPPIHWVPGSHTEKISHDVGYYVGNNRSKVDTLYQDIPMEYLSSGLKFTVRGFGSNTTGNGHCELRLYAEWRVDGNNPIVGTERGWRSNSWEDVASIDLGEPQIWPNLQDYSITLKKLGATVPGTLRLVIQAKNVRVTHANLELVHEAGYEDTIHIDNGARGEADEVEILGSRIPAEGLENKNFYQGFWKYSGEELITFEDSNHSNGDFLSIQALDRAVSVALARTKTQGLINIPSDANTMPLLVKQDSQNSWVETWEWNLREDEVTIQAMSTPNAEIDIDSEEVVPMTGGGSSSGGSSSGGSGGGSSSGGSGTNLLSVWRSLTNNDDLDDYDSETKIAIEHLSTFLEVVEYTSGHYALKTKASVPFNGDVVDIDGFYSDGFVTAGGVGTSSGGGGDVDLPRVWKSLQNQDTVNTYNDYKISTAHLPTLGNGLAYTDNRGSGTSLATTLGIASGYKLLTTTEWTEIGSSLSSIDSSLTIISAALQSLQSQVDSVASRDNFDELTATAFFADVIAASDIYGALHGNADTATAATTDASGNTITTYYAKASDLSSISARVSTLEARQNWDDIFGIDTNGNVYVKKNGTTARGFWTYGFVTAGGVGTSSGGGGDVDLPRVWKSLQNQDTVNTYNDYKISTAHLPTLGNGLAYTDNRGSGTSLATTLGIASGYKLPTTEEWANVSDNLNSLQALQAQVDSLSTRDNFGELTASALFADVLAASDGYFGAIYGPLHGNADTATSATSAGSSTTASYLVSSSYSEGSGKNPVYFSGGRPVASSSSEGSASLPVYLSSGYLTACTASSLFSPLSSTAATNLSVTVAGQNRTATLYATYDTSSENIASNFSTVGAALKSLQSQIDSVATRNGFDELTATTVFADILAATNIYGALHGNADTATYATSASYATYDSASENIASNFTTVGTALKSLQSQIDSVAANRAFDELTVTAGYFDMLSVGANLNVAGTIYSIEGIYSSGYVTAGAVGSSSDARLKNDIETISAKRAADVIMALRPCEWVWNKKHFQNGEKGAGLIAQDVQEVLPFAVTNNDKLLALNYDVFHAYEIAGLQDHERRLQAIENKLNG